MSQQPPGYPPPGPPQGWDWGPSPHGPAVGQAPHPGWSQPQSPQRRNNTPLILILVILVVAGLGAVLYLNNDDDESSGASSTDDTPEDALRRFAAADTCQALADATTQRWQEDYQARAIPPPDAPPAEGFVDLCQQISDAGTPVAEAQELESVELVSQDGDTAIVRAVIIVEGEPLDSEYTVRVEDGLWRVDHVGSETTENEGGGAEQGAPPPLPGDPEAPLPDASGSDGGLPPPDITTAEPDANGNLPVDVVENIFEASVTGDCELLRESLSESAWTQDGTRTDAEMMDECLAEEPESESALVSAEFQGIYSEPPPEAVAAGVTEPGTAIVHVTTTTEGEQSMYLFIEDGLWQVY
jgi:hypothetical protein